jgi:hypothetical protein
MVDKSHERHNGELRRGAYGKLQEPITQISAGWTIKRERLGVFFDPI